MLWTYSKSSTFSCSLCWTTDALWLQLQKELFGENPVLLPYQAAKTYLLTYWLRDAIFLFSQNVWVGTFDKFSIVEPQMYENMSSTSTVVLIHLNYPLHIYSTTVLPCWALENKENHRENVQKEKWHMPDREWFTPLLMNLRDFGLWNLYIKRISLSKISDVCFVAFPCFPLQSWTYAALFTLFPHRIMSKKTVLLSFQLSHIAKNCVREECFVLQNCATLNKSY